MSGGKLTSRTDRSWMSSGNCWALPTELFVHDHDDRATQAARTKAAKEICATCPVRDVCLAYALENGESFGVWGGTTPRARRRMSSGQIGDGPDLTEIVDTDPAADLPAPGHDDPGADDLDDLEDLDGGSDALYDLLLPDLDLDDLTHAARRAGASGSAHPDRSGDRR